MRNPGKNKKLTKVAFLQGSINRGGSETLILEYFNNARELPFEPMGIYRKKGGLLNEFEKTEIPFFQCKPKHSFDLGYIFRLRRLLLKNNVQIAHTQQPLDTLYALFASLGTGIKVVFTVHRYDDNFPKKAKRYLKLAIKYANRTIFVSKAQKDYYVKNYGIKDGKKYRVIYNGIDFSKIEHYDNSNIRHEIGIPNDVLLMGSVGNFRVGRDHISVCRFLHLLNQEGIDFRFLFVGAKSEREAWVFEECIAFCNKHKLNSKVHFLGSREDVPGILSQLDAFIYASGNDTFGIAVVEAIASGIPVFVNDWDVMKEITEDGTRAVLYKTNNEEVLLRKFKDFLRNQDQYQMRAKENALWVKSSYSFDKHIQSLEFLYNEIS